MLQAMRQRCQDIRARADALDRQLAELLEAGVEPPWDDLEQARLLISLDALAVKLAALQKGMALDLEGKLPFTPGPARSS